VRKLTGTNTAGLNRVYWDLRYEPSKEVRLRTSPLYAPWLRVGPDGTRPAPGAGSLSIFAPPGNYTVKLSSGGRDLAQPLTVRKDPNSGGTEADIEAQTGVLFALRKDLDSAADAVNRIEIARSQIEGLGRVIDDVAIKKAGEDLNQKLMDVEMNLIELRLTGGQDGVRYGSKLISKLNYLANGLAGNDFKPTSQQIEVQKVLEDRLRNVLSEIDGVMNKDLAGFNDMLRKKNVPNIVAKTP
jgi:hypothetical protein